MASAQLYAIVVPKQGVANGLATLDGTAKIPIVQIPPIETDTYKGEYADSIALITAYPTGALGDYAYVTATSSYWYWNRGLATPAWVNQQITEAAYNNVALTAAAKAAVPYIVGV